MINLLEKKVAKNVAISFGYFIFSKNHNEPTKVAQLVKNHQSDHPVERPSNYGDLTGCLKQ